MFLHSLYLIAIIVEAITAALAAGRRNMDWVGVCTLGCVTALGGGSVRDVLLGNHPLAWVEHPFYLLITGGTALLTIFISRFLHHLRKLFLFLDAVGLVVFTLIGCNVAITLTMPFIIIIASGMITGCVGGVLRDILCADIPLLFRQELYAVVSALTGLIYTVGLCAGLNNELMMTLAMSSGLALRLMALRFGWGMPKFIYTKNLH
ncbi:trimeric intracellular cation channel family protein [Enterobacter asburiae]|uniref:trimeric intracellular cation channel family protein n=1 Tax=Scandinavium sp. UTDF21-P1B TaxID=3446379 RepID=UPI00348A8AE4